MWCSGRSSRRNCGAQTQGDNHSDSEDDSDYEHSSNTAGMFLLISSFRINLSFHATDVFLSPKKSLVELIGFLFVTESKLIIEMNLSCIDAECPSEEYSVLIYKKEFFSYE